MRKNKKQRRIMFLLIILLCLTLGFALLSTTLKINGTASIKSNTWDIHWDDTSVNVTSGSVSADTPLVSTTTSTKDTVSFDVELELPGDFYEFEIDAINEGSVDGAINTVSTLIYDSSDLEHPLTGDDIPEYLIYTVKYDDGTAPQDGDILEHGDSKTYKIRLEYDEDWKELPSDDEEYVVKIQIPYVQHKETTTSPIILPTGKTKDTLETGDVIKIQDEEFNFLHYEGTNNEDIVMLAKYNLKVGNIMSHDYDSGMIKTGEYTSSDQGYGLQSSEVRGDSDEESIYSGTVAFSTNDYWGGEPTKPKPEYGISYPANVYDPVNYNGAPNDNNYSVVYYVDNYKTLLTEYGVTIKNARLLTYAEAIDSSIGCNSSSTPRANVAAWSCPTDGFITNTTFWLGSTSSTYGIWHIFSSGSFGEDYHGYDDTYGVRPVIVISKSTIN